MEKHEVGALFLEGLSIHKPNLYYVTRFLTVDNCFYLKLPGKPGTIAATDLVCNRARKLSSIKDFHSLSPIYQKAITEKMGRRELERAIIADITQKLLPLNTVLGIPRDTDAQVVEDLHRCGMMTKCVSDLFFEARETKDAAEQKAIQKASRATEATFKHVIKVIKNAEIGANKVLHHKRKPLTVGVLKKIIEHALVDNASENSQESIVVGGKSGFDWHSIGQRKDKLRANEPIIIDIYPRLIEERYHADITRTVVRGKVSTKVKKMFEAVESALDASIDAVRVGGTSTEMVDAMADSLERDGFTAAHRNPGTKEGMLHGLGHGIGLNVHELPRLSLLPQPIYENAVFAVEPGLYYEKIGGVRIEDNVVATSKGAKRITKLPRTFFL